MDKFRLVINWSESLSRAPRSKWIRGKWSVMSVYIRHWNEFSKFMKALVNILSIKVADSLLTLVGRFNKDINEFACNKSTLRMFSAYWQPFYSGLCVLMMNY